MLLLTVMLLVPSALVSYLVTGWVARNAAKLSLVDLPNERKVHQNPIPLGGGLGIAAGILSVVLAGTAAVYLTPGSVWEADFIQPAGQLVQTHLPGIKSRLGLLWGLVGCAAVLTALGLGDDRRGLPWQLRMAVEAAVAAFVVYVLEIRLTAFIELPWLGSLASVFWIVLLINSFNMIDNMDALSGGVATIAASVLTVMLLTGPLATSGPQLFVAWMLTVLIGSLLGFLVHNWPPARIFMGDAGSYLVGFWIAVATLLSTYTGYNSETPHAILAPLCVLAVPLYDTASVILIRRRSGRSIFQADKKHFSHRLVELGMNRPAAVMTIYVATLTTGLGAILLPRTDAVGAAIIVGIVACVCILIAMLEILVYRRLDP